MIREFYLKKQYCFDTRRLEIEIPLKKWCFENSIIYLKNSDTKKEFKETF